MFSRAASPSAAASSGTARTRKPRRRFFRLFRPGKRTAALPEEHLGTDETSSSGPAVVWGEAGSLFSSMADSRSPATAMAPDGTLHVLWEEGTDIYHSYRRDGFWFLPERVATGERPSIVVDKEGTPHAIFSNEFGGNWEIYYVTWRYETWSLPRNISHTSGISGNPRLAMAPDGTLHAAWADTTPGYSVIYYARRLGNYWVNNRIPSARGGAPTLVVDARERIHVAWQDQDTPFGAFDIYYSCWDGSDWSLPENISFNNSAHSAICDLGLDKDGTAHLVWEEQVDDGWQVFYCYGQVGFWSVPADISQAPQECHLAHIVVTPQDYLHVAWCEGTVVRSGRKGAAASGWFPAETIAGNALGVEDVALTAGDGGEVHAVWAARTATGQRDIFHGERPGAMRRNIYFPLTMSTG